MGEISVHCRQRRLRTTLYCILYALQAAIEKGRDESLVHMHAERCGPESGPVNTRPTGPVATALHVIFWFCMCTLVMNASYIVLRVDQIQVRYWQHRWWHS